MMTIREELHGLIDRLPEDMLDGAREVLTSLEAPPVFTCLGEEPPLDDEPVTNDDLAAMREAEERSEYVSFSEARERLASSH